MSRKKVFVFVFLAVSVFNVIDSFKLTINNKSRSNDSSENVEGFTRQNKTLEIPLYSQINLQISVDVSQLQQINRKNAQLVGFQLNFLANKDGVLKVTKVNNQDQQSSSSSAMSLLENDLYIFSGKGSTKRIFNVYPPPTLHFETRSHHEKSEITTEWVLEGTFIDFIQLRIDLILFLEDERLIQQNATINVLVTQPKRLIDSIFYIILPFLVVIVSVLMGILMETAVLIKILKNPKPVIIGFCAQYLLMPVLSMIIGYVFDYSTLNKLALFVIGCCPGSGASNQWTLLFDGDVNLSALMSFVSTISSFFMMPLYLYTLGRLYTDALSIKIPFLALGRTLTLVVLPYASGILITHYVKSARKFVEKIIKAVMIAMLLFFSTFGIFVNWYLITTIDLKTCLTAPLLPFIGFILGGVLAYIAKLDWSYVKTVGIEAGIQNTGIAFLIILYSFPQPFATQAIMIPLVVALLTTKPFWILYLVRRQRQKYLKRKNQKANDQIQNLSEEQRANENEQERVAVELQKL